MKKIILILLLLFVQGVTAKETTILFLGDSLTEGLGVSKQEAFPWQVKILFEKKLDRNITIINGGISGSTTSDAFARLSWYLKKSPDIIFIALGANDGLRGLNLMQSEKNLEKIVQHAIESNAKVLLAGMLIPPNYGPEYSQQFANMYQKIIKKYTLKNIPFLLEGVAGKQTLNQADGIHPNAQGHKIIAHNVFQFIKDEL